MTAELVEGDGYDTVTLFVLGDDEAPEFKLPAKVGAKFLTDCGMERRS